MVTVAPSAGVALSGRPPPLPLVGRDCVARAAGDVFGPSAAGSSAGFCGPPSLVVEASSTRSIPLEGNSFGLGPWKCLAKAGTGSPCAFCGGARWGPPLQRCSGCKAVRYCGRKCQAAHRDVHGPMCRLAALGVPVPALSLKKRAAFAWEASCAAKLRRFDLPEAGLAEGTTYPLTAVEMMRRRSLRELELGRQDQVHALCVGLRPGTGSGLSGLPELAPAPLAVLTGWLDGRCCAWCSRRRVLLQCPGCQVLFCSWACLAEAWPDHREECRWQLTAVAGPVRRGVEGALGAWGVASSLGKGIQGDSSDGSSFEEDDSDSAGSDSGSSAQGWR